MDVHRLLDPAIEPTLAGRHEFGMMRITPYPRLTDGSSGAGRPNRWSKCAALDLSARIERSALETGYDTAILRSFGRRVPE
jgi:hypothetical protein